MIFEGDRWLGKSLCRYAAVPPLNSGLLRNCKPEVMRTCFCFKGSFVSDLSKLAAGFAEFNWGKFLAIVAIVALPAFVNGYPFYFEDSAAYDGHGLYLPSTGARFNLYSDIPGSIASLFYPVLGVWSLLAINALVFSYVFVKFSNIFLSHVPVYTSLLFLMLTGTPFYISLLSPDIWIVVMGLCIAMLMVRFSYVNFALAVVACSGHGSGIYILVAAVLGFIIIGLQKVRFALLAGAICASSVIVIFLVDLWIYGTVPTEKQAQATIASKIMNDVPEALVDYCDQLPQERICKLKDRVNSVTPHSGDDAQYLWDAHLRDQPDGLTWSEFNELGMRLLFFVLTSRHASTYIVESVYDYVNFFKPDRCLGFSGFVPNAAEEWSLQHYAKGENKSLARSGAFSAETSFCKLFYLSSFTVFVLGLLVFVWTLFHRKYENYDIIVLLYLIEVSNDVFFALFSGGYTRYHLRALSLSAVIVLIACNWLFQQSRRPSTTGVS
jgi:hypothetical protein